MSNPSNQSFRQLSGKYLRKQVNALERQFDGCRLAEDIECIHRARVASRRLREGLRVFKSCYKPQKIRRWSSSIRRLTKSLGVARDADVQIDFIENYLKGLSDTEIRADIEGLLAKC